MPIWDSDRDMLPMGQDSFDAYPTALIGTRYPLAQGLAQMEIVPGGRHGNGLRFNAMGSYLDEYYDATQSNYPGYVPCLYPSVVDYNRTEFPYVSLNLLVPAFPADQEVTILQWYGSVFLTSPSRFEQRTICSLVLQGDGTLRFEGGETRASRPGAFPFGQWTQLQWWLRVNYWHSRPSPGLAPEVPMAVRVEKPVAGGGGATIASHQTVLGPDGVPGNFCATSQVADDQDVTQDGLRVGMIAGTATGITITIDDLVAGCISSNYHNTHLVPPLVAERTLDNAWMRIGHWHDGLWVENCSLTGNNTLTPYPYGDTYDPVPQTLPWVHQGEIEDFRCVDELPAHDADDTMLYSWAPLDPSSSAYFNIAGFRHAPITHTITARTEDVFAMTCNIWDSRAGGGDLHWWCETAGLQWQEDPRFDPDNRPTMQGINTYTQWNYIPTNPYTIGVRAIKLYPEFGCHIGIQWGAQYPRDPTDPESSGAGIGQSVVYTEEEVNATQFWIAAAGPFTARPTKETFVSQVSCEISHGPRWDLVTHTLKPSYGLGPEDHMAGGRDSKAFMRRGLHVDAPFPDHHLCVTGYRHDAPDQIQDDVKFLWHVPAGAVNPDYSQGVLYPSPPADPGSLADEIYPGAHTTMFWWQHPRQGALGTPPVLRLFARARKEGPGPTTLSIIYRKDGDHWPTVPTRVLGTHTLTTEYEYYDLGIPVEPDTGASWTEDLLLVAQFGIRGEATGENVRVSALYIEATWEEPPWEPATPWAGWTEAYPVDTYPSMDTGDPKVLALWFLDSFGQTPTGQYGGAEQYWGGDGRNWAGHAGDWYDGWLVGDTPYPVIVNPDEPTTTIHSNPSDFLNNLVPTFKWPGKYGDVQAEFPGRDGRDGCVKMKGHWSGLCHGYMGQVQNVGGMYYTGQIGFAFKTQPKGDWPSEELHVRLLSLYFQWDILWAMYEALCVTLDVRRDGHLVVNRRGGPMKDLAGAHCVSTIPLPALDEWSYIEIRFHVGPGELLDDFDNVDDSSRPGEINLRINGQDAGNWKDIHTGLDARFNRSGDRSAMGYWHHGATVGGFYGEGIDYMMLGGDVRNPSEKHDLNLWFDDYYEASVTNDYWYEEYPRAQFLGDAQVQLLNQTGTGEHYYGEGFMVDYVVGAEDVVRTTDDQPINDGEATKVTGTPIVPVGTPVQDRRIWIPVTLDPVAGRVMAWQPMAVHRDNIQPLHDWYFSLPGGSMDEVLALADEFSVLSGRSFGNNDPWPVFTYTGFEMYDGWCYSYNPFHPYTDDPDPVTGLYGGSPTYSAEEFNDLRWGHGFWAPSPPNPPPYPQINPVAFTQMCVEVLVAREPPKVPTFIFSQVTG